eukprot:Blabericola_migrator_1__3232@NODE_1951_length_3515_cov_24_442865_g934_i1_p2_GENE_NODE_1951_length_3515_cov_24_442865_g934_i1NODE_1951_length_3515_cov_24_442865_g934_i1_p2_ORF_typecomplete_len278_score3_38RT_RNaseH/PF17917_1/5e31RT_RNaseH_2/PF17919_1/8_1e27Peptidase_A17/PF05380_13/0_013_NODE_1951_length_3515_cov_24_442865_g934_i160893
MVEDSHIMPDPKEAAKFEAIPAPCDIPSLRRFLGCIGYYRSFIPKFAAIARPLTLLLRKDQEWFWSPECQKSFEQLRDFLLKAPLRRRIPHPDWTFVLDTDASTTAIAGVLYQQDHEGNLHLIAHVSKALTPTEAKWSAYELEAYAIVWCILHFAAYLRDRPFLVRTDHKSLRWLWSTAKPRIARWAMALQEFTFVIEYQSGTDNPVADYFSRDIATTPLDEMIDERISMHAELFHVSIDPRVEWLMTTSNRIYISRMPPGTYSLYIPLWTFRSASG